ncbi:MAG: ATP-binding cassette domain-containing protein [Planctomycetes bacterium]|nr:ATP-binding cassette domain-containing protein [Planctomycetota bacterium]
MPTISRKGNQKDVVSHDTHYWLVVRGASHNNLKNIDVEIPLGRFVCVTGVSGSGKSSLVNDILREQLALDLNGAQSAQPGKHAGIDGKEHLDKVIDIDQSPIGRTPRSNPATYIKLFDEVRELFAKLPDSKVRGYSPGRFSFNVSTGENGGGRCEACEGNGQNRVEMDFLADVWTTCPVCDGRRFNHETLQIHFRGKSIHDVLEMDVQQALEHFNAIPKIREMLETLHSVGLDYLKLGQASTTLSGGEAQRIKLAKELVRRSTGRTLYILDEPTTGLHFEDIRKLLAVLHGFVDGGNSVVVIEHNLDVVKTADWVIDLGPEGGSGGGRVVAVGTPEDVAKCAESFTGQALVEMLFETSKSPARRPAGKLHVEKSKQKERGRGAKGPRGQGSGTAAIDVTSDIVVVGAKEHNLKDVTVRIPRGAMTVCSGVSGSGKTSFAMDTVYVEGQRRYVESLSSYARQFLGQFQKPKVDHVYGLSPAIAIEQKAASNTPRSTVGTVTEIYDYMRVLWARVGQPYCPNCELPIGTQSSEEVIDRISELPDGTRALLCAPVERSPGETWESLLARWEAQGYVRARIDGEVVEISGKPKIDARRSHTVELVVDRAVIRAGGRGRIGDSIEHALSLGKGVMIVVVLDGEKADRVMRFSQHFACDKCGTSFDELTPHHFSHNSRMGWCPGCEGLGVQRGRARMPSSLHRIRRYWRVPFRFGRMWIRIRCCGGC